MIKAMLVDDNTLALEYFSTLVDWKKYGFELVCTAIDGEAALINFKKYMPQLVITDVQMPNMNGIELTREILRIAPQTIVIFLSSYEEFTYIRSAMNLGVQDYILKHETKENELAQKLLTVRDMLVKSQQENRFIAEGYLQDYLNKEELPDGGKNESLPQFFSGRYDFYIVEQTHILPVITGLLHLQTEELSEKDIKLFFYQCEENEAVLRLSPYTYLLLSRHAKNVVSASYNMAEDFKNHFHTTLKVLVLADNSSITECLLAYNQQKQWLNQMVFFPASTILYSNTLKQPNHAEQTRLNLSRQIDRLLQDGRFSELLCQMDQDYLASLSAQDYQSFDRLTQAYGSALLHYHHSVMDSRTNTLFEAFNEASFVSWYDASSVFAWLKERYSTLIRLLTDDPMKNYSDFIKNIYLYVYQNYGDSDLSAESIADHFDVSVNQLNILMKRETSTTVWQLLIQVRMEKAKQLLETTDLKSAQISEQIGYKTTSYFSNVFRKYYGISPQEYRRNNKSNYRSQEGRQTRP